MKKTMWILALIVMGSVRAFAQEGQDEVKGQVEGMNETIQEMKNTLDALSKIKISGYIQAQYQMTDTAARTGTFAYPVGNFAGGAFPSNVDSRFAVRRGRLKVTYDNNLSKYVLQVDVTQNGVGIKDAYVEVTEPWMKTFTLTVGAFDRPFGYEISYSSSMREAPERSRMFQTLFPGERELGAKLTIAPQDEFWSHFNLKAGFFNGVLNTANENDSKKDFIGRLGFTLPFKEQNLAIDGGLSLYSGNVTSLARSVYSFDKATASFLPDTAGAPTVNDSLKAVRRQYVGVDAQVYYDIPVIGGAQLRAEYITGDQPGTQAANQFYGNSAIGATVPVYKRKFSGFYITYVQSVGKKNQLVLKYDEFNPNSDVKNGTITNTQRVDKRLSSADVEYKTAGLGWIHHWNSNVKFTFYYEKIWNEKTAGSANTSLQPFQKDLKDNVFTARVQYSF